MRSASKFMGCNTHFSLMKAFMTRDYCLTWVLKLDKVTCLAQETTNDNQNKSKTAVDLSYLHECITVPGCCCMALLHNHLTDSCSYVHKNTLLATKGGGLCLPPPPPPPPPSLNPVLSSGIVSPVSICWFSFAVQVGQGIGAHFCFKVTTAAASSGQLLTASF